MIGAVLRPRRVHRDLGGAPIRRTSRGCSRRTSRWPRAQIEAHGGVVEKFIGDAVVAVFGVPAAHEDDPERAVRAGLRIVEDAERAARRSVERRCGCGSGSTPARRSSGSVSRPGSGEGFLAGDAINTASRIQSVAPEMGVAVGLATYEATQRGVRLRGARSRRRSRARPSRSRVFHALAPRARFGVDLTRTHDSPFVGREIDLALLQGPLRQDRRGERRSQLVTVVGEPGVGQEPARGRARSRTSTSRAGARRPGGRAGACRTGRGSRSGRWARS